jgi:hypothetical protein
VDICADDHNNLRYMSSIVAKRYTCNGANQQTL